MLQAPVLQLDVAKMCELDPRNVENLYGMWAVFSRCADSIAEGNGRRLENLSWRVWARETLCCPPQPKKAIVPTITSPLPSNDDVPSLSNSLGSVSDLDSLQSFPETSALSKSRGKEIHITPRVLGKIITNIHEQNPSDVKPLDPEVKAIVSSKMPTDTQTTVDTTSPESRQSDQPSLSYGNQSSCLSSITTNASTAAGNSLKAGSDTSVSSDGIIRSGSVVHGFSPRASLRSRGSSVASKKALATSPMLVSKLSPANKKQGMFLLGGSSEDDESSFETMMSWRNKVLEPKRSSLSRGLTKEPSTQKKTTSFRDVVEQHNIQHGNETVDDNAIASDDDDDEEEDEDDDNNSVIDDSAIEEDDEEGWEDEQPEEEKPLPQPLFKRVDSSAHLPSRRSVLTQGLTEGERATGLLKAAAKSTPALHRMNRSSGQRTIVNAGSPDEEDGMMMRPVGRGIAVPQPTNEQVYAMAHSPRTTRRHMLSTELTESLRKNLLWERQQKNTTVNAFLKREAKSMANLQQAGRVAAATRPSAHNTIIQTHDTSYDDYFNPVNEYHTKGW